MPRRPSADPPPDPKCNVMLYIDAKLWQAYQTYCVINRLIPSHEVATFLERCLPAHKRPSRPGLRPAAPDLKALLADPQRFPGASPQAEDPAPTQEVSP